MKVHIYDEFNKEKKKKKKKKKMRNVRKGRNGLSGHAQSVGHNRTQLSPFSNPLLKLKKPSIKKRK